MKGRGRVNADKQQTRTTPEQEEQKGKDLLLKRGLEKGGTTVIGAREESQHLCKGEEKAKKVKGPRKSK